MCLTGNSQPIVTRDSRVSRAPPNHAILSFLNLYGIWWKNFRYRLSFFSNLWLKFDVLSGNKSIWVVIGFWRQLFKGHNFNETQVKNFQQGLKKENF